MTPGILVVDDEPASVNLLRITLGMDYTVHTATDGPAALALLARSRISPCDHRSAHAGDERHRVHRSGRSSRTRIWCASSSPATPTSSRSSRRSTPGRVYRYLTKPWNQRRAARSPCARGSKCIACRCENAAPAGGAARGQRAARVENALLKREARGASRFDEIVGASPARAHACSSWSSAWWRPRHHRADLPARPAPARSWSRAPSTRRPPAPSEPFVGENCGAIAARAARRASCSATAAGAFTGAARTARACSSWPTAARCSSTRSATPPVAAGASCCACSRRARSAASATASPITVDVRIIAATNRDLDARRRRRAASATTSSTASASSPIQHPAAARAPRGHPAARRSTSSSTASRRS